MSWDTGAQSSGDAWGTSAATFNEPTATGGGFDGFGGGQSNAFGDASNGPGGFGDAPGEGVPGGNSGGCFNCGQDG